MMGFMQQISDWKCATQSLNENIEAAVGCEQNLIFSSLISSVVATGVIHHVLSQSWTVEEIGNNNNTAEPGHKMQSRKWRKKYYFKISLRVN